MLDKTQQTEMGSMLEPIINSTIRDHVAKHLTNQSLKDIIRAEVSKQTTSHHKIELVDHSKNTIGKCDDIHHSKLQDVSIASNVGNVMLTGPTGAGKTTLCEQIAKLRNVPFFYTGAIQSEYKLLGFIDANGSYKPTAFRQACSQPCVFLLDELDGSSANALLPFNMSLANRKCDFPDGPVDIHPECRFIAATNTNGKGRTRDYVGRNALDAAFLDRFICIDVEYDEGLELAMSCNEQWLSRVYKVRKAIAALQIEHIISPRAIIHGQALLSSGMEQSRVEEYVLFRGCLDKNAINRIKNRIEEYS